MPTGRIPAGVPKFLAQTAGPPLPPVTGRISWGFGTGAYGIGPYATLALPQNAQTLSAAATVSAPAVTGTLAYPPASVWSASDALAANGGSSPITLANGGLDFTPTFNAYAATLRTTISKSSGKLYVEFYATNTGGNMGWGVANASTDPSRGMSQSNNPGSAAWYYGTTAATAGFTANYNSTLWPNPGNTVAMAVDFVNGGIWFAINNVWLNSSNPATDTLPMISFDGTVLPLFAAAGPGQVSDTWTLRSVASAQIYAPPSGFSAWDVAEPQTLSAAATISAPSVTGALTVTQAPQTIVAAARTTIGGALAAQQANQTLAAVGRITVGATLAVNQAAETLAAAGGPRVGGALTLTQGAQALAATGAVTVRGTLATPQAAQTLSAGGLVISGVVGTLVLTQAPQTLAASGRLGAVGHLAVTQDAQTLVAAGGIAPALGHLAVTQDDQTLDAAGHLNWAALAPCEFGEWTPLGHAVGFGRGNFGAGVFADPTPIGTHVVTGGWLAPVAACEFGEWTLLGHGIGYGRENFSAGPFGGARQTGLHVVTGGWEKPPADCGNGSWTPTRLAA